METTQPSRAKAYFEEIKAGGIQFLNRLVGSATLTYESEFLDFKGGRELVINGDDLLNLWAKNLSCFANSDGGVVIFGINAPQGAAKSLSLVQDLAALQERLKSLIPRVTEPPVQRVEIAIFPDSANANIGFVVCHIPASPWRPHQVRVGGQPNQFYIRAADNCIPCNHSTLRALFAPQYVSRLEVTYHVVIRQHFAHPWSEAILQCWLTNAGPATAIELFVLCENQHNMPTPEFDHRIWEESVSARRGLALKATRSVHPDEKLHLFNIVLGTITSAGVKTFKNDVFRFAFSLSARNQGPIKCEINVPAQDVEDGTLMSATYLA